MQEVDSSVLAQTSMRVMGKYELGWMQALVTQNASNGTARLAPAPARDDDEGTEGGIFIGEQGVFLMNAPSQCCHWQLQAQSTCQVLV